MRLTWLLCIFIPSALALIQLAHAQNQAVCLNLDYSGPIKDVIQLKKPTPLAEATRKVAEVSEGFALDMIAGAIGGIPFVGTSLGTLFSQIVSVYGSNGLSADDVYNSLREEIDQLKRYMDQEIVELKVDQIRNKFGTDRGGMLSYAQHCVKTFKEDPEDMAHCLENLRAMLVQQYHFFLPENNKAASYEQTLPLFRMYGQLYVDTLLDQIHVAKKRGKNVQAVEHAKALIAMVEEFKRHNQTSVDEIVKYQIAAHVMPTTNNPTCAPLGSTQFCVCTIAIGPSKFDAVDAKGYPTDKTKNFCVGITYGVDDPCRYAESGYRFKYKPVHEAAIKTYWKLQLGDAVAAWEKIAETLKPMVANHKRSLSLPERIKFERDVAAVIAREKRAMYKRADA